MKELERWAKEAKWLKMSDQYQSPFQRAVYLTPQGTIVVVYHNNGEVVEVEHPQRFVWLDQGATPSTS